MICRHVGKSELNDDVHASCVVATVESIVSALENSADVSAGKASTSKSREASSKTVALEVSETLMKVIVQVVSLLYRRQVAPQEAARLCRCLARTLAQHPTNQQLTYVLHVLGSVCRNKDATPNGACSYTQECVLWYMWYFLLQPKYIEVLNVGLVDSQLMHWKTLSCTLLREWSLKLPPMECSMASRLTCQLIRLASVCDVEIFRMLSSLQVIRGFKLGTLLLCTNERYMHFECPSFFGYRHLSIAAATITS